MRALQPFLQCQATLAERRRDLHHQATVEGESARVDVTLRQGQRNAVWGARAVMCESTEAGTCRHQTETED